MIVSSLYPMYRYYHAGIFIFVTILQVNGLEYGGHINAPVIEILSSPALPPYLARQAELKASLESNGFEPQTAKMENTKYRRNNIDQFFNIILNLLNNKTYNYLKERDEYSDLPVSDKSANNKINNPSASILVPTSNSYLQLTKLYKNCSAKLQIDCCTVIGNLNNKNFSFICYQCDTASFTASNNSNNNTKQPNNDSEADCPCLCNLALISFTSNNYPVLGSDVAEDAESPNYEISLNFYTLILSIGLPCISILMMICTLISLVYCCKLRSKNTSNTSNREAASNETHNDGGNTNLSFIYVDVDAQYGSANSERRKYDGEPPKYNEIFTKSRQIDKLPTYKSFRQKNSNKLPFV